jgi:hypothetical protein
MFRPKQKRAKFTSKEDEGKLLRTFPWVRERKVKNPLNAMSKQRRQEMVVEKWVTREKRFKVGVRREL